MNHFGVPIVFTKIGRRHRVPLLRAVSFSPFYSIWPNFQKKGTIEHKDALFSSLSSPKTSSVKKERDPILAPPTRKAFFSISSVGLYDFPFWKVEGERLRENKTNRVACWWWVMLPDENTQGSQAFCWLRRPTTKRRHREGNTRLYLYHIL